ncbi:MAG: hypothetical protein GX117_12750 [Candidatus Hydrogenedentes bacterium]|jgi:hypothetical protein|nr:hypothetical protein [Candidatus Hydrogenedentota bacterium]
MTGDKRQLMIVATENGTMSLDTHFDEETARLSMDQMAQLYERDKSTISRHINTVFDEGRLSRDSVVAKPA